MTSIYYPINCAQIEMSMRRAVIFETSSHRGIDRRSQNFTTRPLNNYVLRIEYKGDK